MKARARFLLMMLTLWAAALLPAHAYAVNYTLLTCTVDADGRSAPTPNTKLFPVIGANDEGAFCATTTPIIEHVFSWVICRFTTVLNDVLGKLYCGMQEAMLDTFGFLATLYIVITGVQLLIGTVQMTARDMLVRFLKLAGVFMFISQATWGIAFAFNFFMDSIFSGIYWVVGSVIPDQVNLSGGGGVKTISDAAGGPIPDKLLLTKDGEVMPIYQYIDTILYSATIGPLAATNAKVIGVFIAMSVFLPPLFMMAATWLWISFSIMVKAVVNFLLGISAIAFLISLSPIFLSFMLFQATVHFFESWLKYMISYTLQIIIVFACVGLWIASTYLFVDFFNQLSDVTFKYGKIESVGPGSKANEAQGGLCPLSNSTTSVGNRPVIRCQNNSFNPWGDRVDGSGNLLDPSKTPNPGQQAQIIPPSKFPTMEEFIKFIVYHMTALLIIAYAFNSLLTQAPHLAKQLAGPEYVPILGQGFGFNRYGIAAKGAPRPIMENTTNTGGARGSGGGGIINRGSEAIRQFVSDTQKSLVGNR